MLWWPEDLLANHVTIACCCILGSFRESRCCITHPSLQPGTWGDSLRQALTQIYEDSLITHSDSNALNKHSGIPIPYTSDSINYLYTRSGHVLYNAKMGFPAYAKLNVSKNTNFTMDYNQVANNRINDQIFWAAWMVSFVVLSHYTNY